MGRIVSILALLAFLYHGQAGAATSKPVPITATSWLVASADGQVIQGSNTEQQRSIASITKLMTVMVVLDANQDLTETIGLYTRSELIQLAMVKSDNKAAQTLCENYPGGEHACVYAMNLKASQLGLTKTKYIEPTGLSIMNVSTAEELIKIVIAAQHYAPIVEASKTSQVKIKLKKKWFIFNNTNPIIG